MTGTAHDANAWLARNAAEPFAYLTTTGRRSGRPHRIEIWFAVERGRVYLLAGGRDRSDWVRNLIASPAVAIEIGGDRLDGIARVLEGGSDDDERARDLLVAKYATPASPLDDWKRRSLAVAVDFPTTDALAPALERNLGTPAG